MKRLIGLFGLMTLFLGISILPASAQPSEWDAWMYNSDNGHMVRVGSDNAIYNDLTLPGLQGNDYSWRSMVSPDGNIVVYTLNNTFNQMTTIQAYNVMTNTLLVSYVIPSQQGQLVYTSIDLIPTTEAFSPDSRSVAVGYTIDGAWSLLVFDLFNQPGNILMQINSTDPSMGIVQSIAIDVPTVVRYDGVTIDFIIVQAATEGSYTYQHFTYNTAVNTIAQNYYFSVAGGDFNARDGRFIFTIPDYRLPNSNQSYQGFGQQVNALHMWLPNTVETYPIFNAPNHSIARPTFIQNGEKILLTAYDWNLSTSQWWTISQSNPTPTTLSTLTDLYPTGLEGVGNGFLMSTVTNDVVHIFPQLQNLPERTTLLYFDTRVGANGTAVNQMWLGNENQQYKLVWARDNQLASRPLVGQWASIGEPMNGSNIHTLTQPSAQVVPSGSLQIGGQARVFTTAGDRANMRSGPGTNFSVVEQVANDTTVTVLEGPQNAGGFVWWRVETASNSGWVVESADGVRVLQPMAIVGVPATVVAPISPPSSNLVVGGFATVTTEGNNLNARRQPSTNAPVVTILKAGQTYSIISGPTVADGFTWWQIGTPEGRAWVAEGTDAVKWIIPS